MPSFLTFTDETLAYTALTKINQNMGMPIVSIDAATHKPEPDCQLTLKWNNIKKAHDLSMWFFAKPEIKYMVGVVGFVEQEYNESWLPPIPDTMLKL